jgi:hypothetical protein
VKLATGALVALDRVALAVKCSHVFRRNALHHNDEEIWAIWARAKSGERQMFLDILKAVTKKRE